MTPDDALRTSPLHDRHVALGAKLADFGGWQMPIEYAGSGGGVLIEHQSVRESVGVFDVSHLGKARVHGPGAAAYINATLSNDLDRIGPGSAQYTMCCDDATGGVVDDLIVYLNSADDVFLIPNAANTAEVVRRLQAEAPDGVQVENQHDEFGIIAVQGPRSADLLRDLGLPTEHDYMAFERSELGGVSLTVCRTGYTGEHGFELVVPWGETTAVWDTLLDRGAAYDVRPCGLGARDTLRTEMGYPLHGQDLSMDITPNQARAGWAVGWKKPRFWGREVLSAEREAKPARVLRGIRGNDRRGIPRPGMQLSGADGAVIGEVTSGTFSPTLKVGIGLALVARDSGLGEGDEVSVDIRGRSSTMTIVKPPFVQTNVR